jgi:hypothetical protein
LTLRLQIIILNILDDPLNDTETGDIGNLDDQAVVVKDVHEVEGTLSQEEEELLPEITMQQLSNSVGTVYSKDRK